uniref:Aquaporin-3 n=1 Tax=Phallusia mammillata TaxID=59560 RepID=A0A6F9D7C3_9ASCI|nr:aquaporin-3 [Phallusia mammillata]
MDNSLTMENMNSCHELRSVLLNHDLRQSNLTYISQCARIAVLHKNKHQVSVNLNPKIPNKILVYHSLKVCHFIKNFLNFSLVMSLKLDFFHGQYLSGVHINTCVHFAKCAFADFLSTLPPKTSRSNMKLNNWSIFCGIKNSSYNTIVISLLINCILQVQYCSSYIFKVVIQ